MASVFATLCCGQVEPFKDRKGDNQRMFLGVLSPGCCVIADVKARS